MTKTAKPALRGGVWTIYERRASELGRVYREKKPEKQNKKPREDKELRINIRREWQRASGLR